MGTEVAVVVVKPYFESGLTSHQTHVMLGTVFYGSNDPTNSVKALKEGPKD